MASIQIVNEEGYKALRNLALTSPELFTKPDPKQLEDQMAKEAGVKKLVLVHIGPNLAGHGPMEKGLGDIRSVYDGEVVFSDELLTVDI